VRALLVSLEPVHVSGQPPWRQLATAAHHGDDQRVEVEEVVCSVALPCAMLSGRATSSARRWRRGTSRLGELRLTHAAHVVALDVQVERLVLLELWQQYLGVGFRRNSAQRQARALDEESDAKTDGAACLHGASSAWATKLRGKMLLCDSCTWTTWSETTARHSCVGRLVPPIPPVRPVAQQPKH